MLDINIHNNQSCTEIVPTFLSSAERLKHRAVAAMDSLNETKKQKIYRQTMHVYCHSPENHEWAVKTRVPIAYLKFDEIQNDYLNQTLVFL